MPPPLLCGDLLPATPDESMFNYLPENVDLNDKNTAVNKLSKKSETFNFSREDAVPENEFNEVFGKG